MRAWIHMLGGLIVWAAHFLGVYALASLGAVTGEANATPWRAAIAGFSLLCLIAALGLVWDAVRRLRRARSVEGRFAPELAALGAGLAAVAILWQALPAWIGG